MKRIGHGLRRLLVGGRLVALVAVAPLALLSVADLVEGANLFSSPTDGVRWTLEHGDHLHFAVHVLSGRLLDVCPCTREAARDHYQRAQRHARSPRQMAAVSQVRPHSVGEWWEYATAPLRVGAEWARDGIAWLGGDRPLSRAEVVLSLDGCMPAVVHVTRGATVVWRNADSVARFLVFPESSHSIQRIEPGSTLSAIFPVRGSFEYACSPQPDSSATNLGVVVVD